MATAAVESKTQSLAIIDTSAMPVYSSGTGASPDAFALRSFEHHNLKQTALTRA